MDDTGRPGAAASVVAVDEQDAVPVELDRWVRLLEAALLAEGVGDTEVSLTFVDEATIAELKREHLDGDGLPTDVLAFPIDEPGEVAPGDGWPGGGPSLLGDIVVCPAVAVRQAPEHAGTVEDELALLIVHGLLHLLGMDHAADADREAMQARERELLDRLHGPLAADPWASGVEP